MRVTLEEELLLDALRQNIEYLESIHGETSLDEIILCVPVRKSIESSCLFACKKLVDLSDESRELRYEFNDTLRNNSYTEVLTIVATLFNCISDVVCDLSKRHLLSGNFLTDQADVRLSFKSAFECNVRSGTAHYLDEVPVFLSGVSITLDVADKLGICLSSCIKTKGSFDIFVLEVTVDGLRAADYLNACVLSSHVLSECSGVCVGVVTTDDNDSGKTVLLSILSNDVELFLSLEFCSAGADDVETTCVSIRIDELVIELNIVVLKKSVRTALESKKNILLVCCFKSIIKTGNNVVSARSLSTGEDNTYDLLFSSGCICALFKSDLRLTICVREESLDLVLICYALCSSTFFNADISNTVSEHARKLRLILVSCFLKW